MKTLVIGLDAASWRIINPLVDAGKLPNLGELVSQGVTGSLESTVPPMTPQAWTSMATGVNPGGHGIYDFLTQNRETYRVGPVDYSTMSAPAIWDIFDSEGVDIGVINFPIAHPPREVDSFFISGIPAPNERDIAFPQEVQDYLNSLNFRVHPHVDPEVDVEKFFQEICSLTEVQTKATVGLLDEYDPELLWTVFMGIDWVQHYLWEQTVDGQDAVETIYTQIDRAIGEILDEVEEECSVLVVSDHGARPIEGVVHLNSLLERLDYLDRNTTDRSTYSRIRQGVLDVVWSVGVRLPAGFKRRAKQLSSKAGLVEFMKEATGTGQRGLHEQINWEKTQAFSYGYMGRIFLHLQDQYPVGTIPSAKYERVRQDLASDLKSVTNPMTDEKLFKAVLPGEEVYSGGDMESAPDLVLVPRDWAHTVYGDFSSRWIHPPRNRIADHEPEGIFIASGEPFEGPSTDVDDVDIAPTLLYLHGMPVLDEMDGEVLEDIFTESFRAGREVESIKGMRHRTYGSDTDDENEQQVKDRLKDLGYL